ncbi:Ig-like domain-containing protein, partial [Bradyrhizobium japonicum]|uniref:Ig-like domain-containing protein n=1 Tax=Bradyrhizobium japonicum TaxID=375 RepID=UPI001364D449
MSKYLKNIEFSHVKTWVKFSCGCAINLKSFTISLNEAIDADTVVASATATATDTVKVQNASGALVNIAATVSEDGKTVTVVNTGGAFTQLQNLTLKIDGVKSEDGSKTLTGHSQTVQVKDVTAPEVVSAVATSPKTVEVTFSEPVNGLTATTKVWDEFYIDGIKAYGTLDVSKLASSNKVTLTLGTALTVGDHALKVTGLSDYANFPAAEKTVTISVAADVVAPSIASAKLLTTTSAEIAFDEPVDNASVQAKLNSADFTIEGQQVTAATPKADGKTYTITWATPLDKGALVEVVISYKGFKDNYGNTVAEAKTFKFAASDDAVAPTVTGVTVNADNTLELTFSEDVVNFGAADLELYDKDNKKLSNVVTPAGKLINSVTSKKVYTLTITGGTSLSGAHSLKVLKDGVTDLSVRGNKNAEQSFAVTLNDKVAPQVSKAEFVNETTGVDFNTDSDEKDSKITIFFNEAMDASTLTNKANFLLGGVPVSEVAGASLTASADNKSVTLTVNKGASDTQVTFATSTDLRVLAVKDAAGNTLDTAQLNKDLGSNDLGLIAQFASAPALTTAVSAVE